jgi:hypothetical protein
MKNLHPARKRLLLGVLFMLTAFFYAFAPACGLIGQFVHFASSRLLGQTGSTLLALGLFVAGALFILPHDALGRMFRWALHGREARVASVVRESDEWVRAAEVKRIVAEALKGVRAVVPVEEPKVPVEERRKRDDVRTALKGLGYKATEFEGIVTALDVTMPIEDMLRTAIKTMHTGAN